MSIASEIEKIWYSTFAKCEKSGLTIKEFCRQKDVDNDTDHYVEILDIHSNEVEVYEVEMEDGTKISCSMDHKFLCEDKKMHPLKEIISQGLQIMCKQ